MTKQPRNYVVMAICLLGLIFALAYPMVAFGQEPTTTAPDPAVAIELKDLQIKLQLEQINVENLNFRVNTNKNQIDRLQKLNDNLNIALGILQKKIAGLQAQIQAFRDKIAAVSKGTPVESEKKNDNKE